jgi:hypothetical protein
LTLISRLNDAITGDSLLQVLRDTKGDLVDIRKGLGKIANVLPWSGVPLP